MNKLRVSAGILFSLLVFFAGATPAPAGAWPCSNIMRNPSDGALAHPTSTDCSYTVLAIITETTLAIAYPKTLKTVGVINRSLNTDWFNNEELNMIIDNNWVTQLGSMQTLRFPVYEKPTEYDALADALFTAEQYYVVLHAPLAKGVVDIYLHDIDYVKFSNSPFIAVPPALEEKSFFIRKDQP